MIYQSERDKGSVRPRHKGLFSLIFETKGLLHRSPGLPLGLRGGLPGLGRRQLLLHPSLQSLNLRMAEA